MSSHSATTLATTVAPPPPKARIARPPPKGKYKILALLDAPRRMIRPGCMAEKEDIESPNAPQEKFGGATAGVVRGMERVKLSELTLDDVLAGKHTPPLTLRDFEDFLAFKTKSSENLYFEIWLRNYEKLYTAWSTNRTTTQQLVLTEQYRLCLDAFFNSASPLELNTSANERRDLDNAIAAVETTSSEPFLAPAAFERVRADSNMMLVHNFKMFLANQARNADRNRAWFAQFLGITTYLLGLIPTIVCTQVGAHRGYRAIGLFFWWFGMVVFIGGFKRTCLVIYLFGDSRQLYAYELAAHEAAKSDSRSIHSDWSNPSTIPSAPDSPSADEGYHSRKNSVAYFPSSPSMSSAGSFKSAPASPTLYFAPSVVLPTLPKSSPVWAPFTRVMSPVVCRAQRDTVAKAAGIALLVMIATAAICLAVPNRR